MMTRTFIKGLNHSFMAKVLMEKIGIMTSPTHRVMLRLDWTQGSNQMHHKLYPLTKTIAMEGIIMRIICSRIQMGRLGGIGEDKRKM